MHASESLHTDMATPNKLKPWTQTPRKRYRLVDATLIDPKDGSIHQHVTIDLKDGLIHRMTKLNALPSPGDETLVHRVRNFGEDLWRLFYTGEQAKIDLAAVDSATTRLKLILVTPKHHGNVMDAIAKTLKEHYFTDIAHVSERRSDEI